MENVRCVDGFFPGADVVVRALQDIPDGYEANVVVRPVGWDEPGGDSNWLVVQHLSLRSTGESQQVLVDLPDPAAAVIWTEVRKTSYPYDPVALAPVTVPAPSCPPSPTAPTVTAEVARPASDDEGGAIAVTMTDPPGSREYNVEFRVEWLDAPPDRDYPHRNFTSWWRPNMSPEDGEQLVQIVDEFDGQSGDCCTDDPPPTPPDDTPLTLGPGRYRITYTWLVFVTGFEGAQRIDGEPVELTLPFEQAQPAERAPLRVATFNVSLSRPAAGDLIGDLSTPGDPQAAAVAEIIQRTRPDVVLLNEFDFDADAEAVDLFRTNYLEVGRNGADPIEYPYVFTAPVNTGVPSGFDLDNDGTVGGANDAIGFGEFGGQYGMVVLSRYPIGTDEVRTFRNLLWGSMPRARLPDDPATAEPGDWYSADELAVLPLPSQSYWDVPIDVHGDVIHLLASHLTPPTFDADEDRNGLRNADEIRFWADYVAGSDTTWIVDDTAVTGGLAADAEFVIVGDLNADPVDGDSVEGAIQQLLDLGRVQDPLPASTGGPEAASEQGGVNETQLGDPATDTADLADDPAPGNLRADYILPSRGLEIVDAGVFWPPADDPLSTLVSDPATSSDHRLVWVDLR